MSVVIETTIGDITVDLFIEERQLACLNFLKLCKLKYYNFNLFHTVQQGFIAQTGDPTGAGDGGGSVWNVLESTEKRFFKAENLPKIYHSTSGLLSLVGVSKYLVGSQFFFTLGENLLSLDGQHCVIGEVVEGHEVLRKLNEAIVDEKFRPYQDIRITHTVILDDPFPDPNNLREPNTSPPPTAERLKNGRIAADEDINDTVGKTAEEIQEMLAEREAKARATILEIVGDIPNAEIAPPENVLFVCKLNPVTTEDDLEIIFSRFGVVKSCEVIRDKKSGDSLQYAFVEFEDKKACERAYFKMDNVLIDDRRIHVDFSQSVAKIKWFGKGRRLEGNRNWLDFNNLRGNGNSQQRGKVEVKKKQSKHHEKIKEHFTRDKPYRTQEHTYHSTSTSRSRESRYEGNEICSPAECVDSNIERRIKKETDSEIEQKRRKNSRRTKTPNNTSESESSNNQEYGVSSSHNGSPNAKRHKKKHSKRSRKDKKSKLDRR